MFQCERQAHRCIDNAFERVVMEIGIHRKAWLYHRRGSEECVCHRGGVRLSPPPPGASGKAWEQCGCDNNLGEILASFVGLRAPVTFLWYLGSITTVNCLFQNAILFKYTTSLVIFFFWGGSPFLWMREVSFNLPKWLCVCLILFVLPAIVFPFSLCWHMLLDEYKFRIATFFWRIESIYYLPLDL